MLGPCPLRPTRSARSEPERARLRRLPMGILWLGGSLVLGCQSEEAPRIALEIEGKRLELAPKTALAEYIELPTEPDELRITLATFPMNCSETRAPRPGEVMIALTLRVPKGKELGPGEYEWKGISDDPKGLSEPAVFPFVRLEKEGRLLHPGGKLKLSALDKTTLGLVQGDFDFHRMEGQALIEMTRDPLAQGTMRGAFSAKLCRVSLDPARAKQAAGSVIR